MLYDMKTNHQVMVEKFKTALSEMSRDVWRCDPKSFEFKEGLEKFSAYLYQVDNNWFIFIQMLHILSSSTYFKDTSKELLTLHFSQQKIKLAGL